MLIAIDMGGTTARVAAFKSVRSTTWIRRQNVTIHDNHDLDIINIRGVIDEITGPDRVDAVGVAQAGKLDRETGILLKSPNLPSWCGHSMKAELERLFPSRPVTVENDAYAIALNQANLHQGKSSFLAVVWGTGVGARYVEYRRGRSVIFAQEPGHIVLNWQDRSTGPICGCEQRGCLESYCGGSGIQHRYGVSADKLSEVRWDLVCRNFARGLHDWVVTHDVSSVYFGGDIAAKQSHRLATIEHYLNGTLKIASTPKLALVDKGEDAGLHGALALLRKKGI